MFDKYVIYNQFDKVIIGNSKKPEFYNVLGYGNNAFVSGKHVMEHVFQLLSQKLNLFGFKIVPLNNISVQSMLRKIRLPNTILFNDVSEFDEYFQRDFKFKQGRDFGFRSDFSGENTGTLRLYMTLEMAEYLTGIEFENVYKVGHFKQDISAHYQMRGNPTKYLCTFFMRRVKFSDKFSKDWVERVGVSGTSGSHGFFGGAYYVKDNLSGRNVKVIYDQLLPILGRIK